MGSKLEFTGVECQVLTYLGACRFLPGLNATYMALKLHLDYSHLLRTLHKMEWDGWVERFRSENVHKWHWRILDEAVLKRAMAQYSGLGLVTAPNTAEHTDTT